MLLADAPTISISIEAAGTLGVSIATGIAGAAKLLVSFMRAELRAAREERAADRVLLKKALRAVGGLKRAIAGLSGRLERIEEHTAELPNLTKEK